MCLQAEMFINQVRGMVLLTLLQKTALLGVLPAQALISINCLDWLEWND
jgi:hypothetical protein